MITVTLMCVVHRTPNVNPYLSAFAMGPCSNDCCTNLQGSPWRCASLSGTHSLVLLNANVSGGRSLKSVAINHLAVLQTISS